MIMFCIMALVMMIGMVADNDVDNRKNFTLAFCLLVIAIIAFAIKLI